MLPHVPFYFLRHGETDWNRRRVMQGHIDIALNEVGIRQAMDVAPAVAQLPIKTICVSTLSRARRTAEIVNVNNAPIVVLDTLKECGFGVYEGQDSNGPWREGWMAGGAIEGGERRVDYIARVHRALNEALSHPAPVLIVAHGGTFWAMEELLGEIVHVQNCTLFEMTPPPADRKHWKATQLACPVEPPLAIGHGR
ncbi:MAG: histidine phosphatase family protein [Rhodospirillaceae bacterium]|nr:histidine phosphatase family protein [Rhodospirillaceae bacterium]